MAHSFDANKFIRTWANFGGSKGTNSRKSVFEDIMKHAASNPDLRSPTNRYWNHQTGKLIEEDGPNTEADKKHLYNGAWDRDHFFELQFLAAVYTEVAVDFDKDVMSTVDFLTFLSHVCNGAHNLCDIGYPVHQAKNAVFTQKGQMTKELLLYLQACYNDFKKFVDSELTGENDQGKKGHPSKAYFEFLKALKTTPFYTNNWPAIGQVWWLA